MLLYNTKIDLHSDVIRQTSKKIAGGIAGIDSDAKLDDQISIFWIANKLIMRKKNSIYILTLVLVLFIGWILRNFKIVYNVKDTYYVVDYFTVSQGIAIVMTFVILFIYTFIRVIKFYKKGNINK